MVLLIFITGCQTAQQQETTTTTTTTSTSSIASSSTTTSSTGTTASTTAGTNITLKGSINKRQSSLGYADFYGEVQNIGSTTVNFVEVHITMKNSSGGVIATDFSFIDGTVLKTSSNTNTCLRPGDTGAFCVSTLTNYTDVASFTSLIDWETYANSNPNASFEIVGSITEGDDYSGNREYLGEIRNKSTTAATFVEIIFVSKDSAGKIIDISSSFVTGTDVPAGATRSFDVNTSAFSTEVASYYYMFDWSD
jgi:hypothetical protein